MIVMYPDEVASVYDLRQLLGETSIDPSVAFGGFEGKMREIETIMVNRPQNFIRKSKVVFSVIAFGKRHCYKGAMVVCDTRQSDFGFIGDYLAIPSEPHPAVFAEGVENRNGQPTGSLCARRIGDTVRCDDQTPHIAFSHERDNRTAQLMIPTSE